MLILDKILPRTTMAIDDAEILDKYRYLCRKSRGEVMREVINYAIEFEDTVAKMIEEKPPRSMQGEWINVRCTEQQYQWVYRIAFECDVSGAAVVRAAVKLFIGEEAIEKIQRISEPTPTT